MLATKFERWQREWLQEGLQKGLQEGRQEGRQEGEAALLLRQLERRFGALPEPVRARVLAADTTVLEEWGLRILDAASLDEIVGGEAE
jgi:predicted transposase YdaD